MTAGKATDKPRGKAKAKKGMPATTPFDGAARAAGLAPQTGKQAMKSSDRKAVQVAVGARFSGSVDLDAHFKPNEPNAHRWDYGLGVQTSQALAYWVEPHPASSTGEAKVMLQKLDWLRRKLGSASFGALRKQMDAARAVSGQTPFRWIATAGAIAITRGSREARLIAAKGLAFPVRSLRLPN